MGTGASPIGEHAAARALSELIQQAVLPGADRARAAGERLAPWPPLGDCLTLPTSLLDSGVPGRYPYGPRWPSSSNGSIQPGGALAPPS